MLINIQHDLMKRRTCTLGLHGPWGDASSVFMRVTFTFPRSYPYSGIPTVEVERNPLISIRVRTYIQKRLRFIRQNKRPCLEACLRFLLFGTEDEDPPSLESRSSSEDDEDLPRRNREATLTMLRNNKNITEPRTSQGCFGPNGWLYLET